MRRFIALFPALIAATVLGAAAPRLLQAQELRGTVRDSASAQPIAGAVLMLLNGGGAVVGRNITNERGQYRIALTGEIQRVRVVRIGFRPRETAIPTVSGGVAQLDITMASLPTMLEPVRVSAGAQCPRRPNPEATFALLEQARAGLLATIVARDANPASLVRLVFDRTMDGDRIATQRIRVDSAVATARSFSAVHSATDFVQRGFMTDSAHQQIFFGPDADVLLDEGFAAGYCFRILDPDRARPKQVGLGFAPANRRRGRVDIEGALWIDTAARALRDLEYKYLGLDRRVEALDPGGRTSFREMANGVVLIDQWALRLPTIDRETVQVDVRDRTREWFRTTETGGELVRARWDDGYTWHASLGTLTGRAVTRDGKPAPGIVIRLADTPYRVTSAQDGTFEISDLAPGPYNIVAGDDRLTPIGLDIPMSETFVAARDSVVHRTLTVRSAEDYVTDRCVQDKRFSPGDSASIMGRVVTANGTPVGGVVITLRDDRPRAEGRRLPESYRPGTNGLFQFCGGSLVRDMAVTVQAWRDGALIGSATRSLTNRLTVVRLVVDAPR